MSCNKIKIYAIEKDFSTTGNKELINRNINSRNSREVTLVTSVYRTENFEIWCEFESYVYSANTTKTASIWTCQQIIMKYVV